MTDQAEIRVRLVELAEAFVPSGVSGVEAAGEAVAVAEVLAAWVFGAEAAEPESEVPDGGPGGLVVTSPGADTGESRARARSELSRPLPTPPPGMSAEQWNAELEILAVLAERGADGEVCTKIAAAIDVAARKTDKYLRSLRRAGKVEPVKRAGLVFWRLPRKSDRAARSADEAAIAAAVAAGRATKCPDAYVAPVQGAKPLPGVKSYTGDEGGGMRAKIAATVAERSRKATLGAGTAATEARRRRERAKGAGGE